jgi:hypothetical protein
MYACCPLLLLRADRNNQPGVKKPVVFLQHGVTLASDCFTVFGANESMAYILADAGAAGWGATAAPAAAPAASLAPLHQYCHIHQLSSDSTHLQLQQAQRSQQQCTSPVICTNAPHTPCMYCT